MSRRVTVGAAGSRADRRRADRTALKHLVRGIATRPETAPEREDLLSVREAAVARLLRLRVALSAIETGRVGFRSSAVPEGSGGVSGDQAAPPSVLLDQVGAAYPGWLFAPGTAECSVARSLSKWSVAAEDRQRAIEALAASTGSGESAVDGRVGPAADYPHLQELELVVGDSDSDGETVLAAREWGGDGPLVLSTESDRRQAGGTYYTPPSVVDGVVERALCPAIRRIRAESETPVESLSSLRVADPAVGTGRFLFSAVECIARAVGETADDDPDALRREVAERCVYGVDLDPLAVELARATLWLRTGATDHVDNFQAGDALVGSGPGETESVDGGDLGDRALDWEAAFPEVVPGSERPFDAVVGNPPYVRSRALPEDVRSHLRERYRTATGSFDLYVPFLERAATLGERVGMVVSNKWTTARYARKLRSLLVEEWAPATVVDCSALDVFPEADVYPVVLACVPGDGGSARDRARGSPLSVRTVSDPAAVGPGAGGPGEATSSDLSEGRGPNCDRAVRSPALETEGTAPVDRGDGRAGNVRVSASFLDRIGGVVPVDLDPAFAPTLERVLADCEPWGEFVEMAEGIHTGNARETLVVDEELDEACRPLADGRSIDRYRVVRSGEWVRFDPSLVGDGEYADLREPELFEEPKLLVRDISDRPVAAYDDEGLYALNTLYSVRPTGDLPARYLLAVFNSAFVARFFESVYGGTSVRDGYLRFKPTFLERIPVPDPSPDRLSAATREEIAAHPATGVDAPEGIEDRDDVTDTLGSLTRTIETAKADRTGVETDLSAHLDDEAGGPRLGDVPGVSLAEGLADTPLSGTTADRDALRVGSVGVTECGGELVVEATARFKPDGDPDLPATGPDAWGYVETDSYPALRVDPGDQRLRDLVRSFVPMAVDRGDGFAGFRPEAGKTISPLDRLRGIRLPDPDEVAPTLAEYRGALRRAAELDRRATRTDELVDRAVADLYGLDAGERALLPSQPP
jgi:hypothetical protein